jgi:hypothetical protein
MKPNYIPDSDWQFVNSICNTHEQEPYMVGSIGWHETEWGTIGIKRDFICGYAYFGGGKYLAKYKGFENNIKGTHNFITWHMKFPVTLESLTEFAVNHWKSSVPKGWAKGVYKQFMIITTMKPYENLTRNITFRESFSTKVIAGIQIKRQVPPEEKYMPDVIMTAEDTQNIRDNLNRVFGADKRIGYRNKLNEIMIIINSFWRQGIFQHWLYINYLNHRKPGSETDHSDHEEGTAIDLATPKGMTAQGFYLFIINECKTRFNWFKTYSWGVHCSRR